MQIPDPNSTNYGALVQHINLQNSGMIDFFYYEQLWPHCKTVTAISGDTLGSHEVQTMHGTLPNFNKFNI